MFRELEKVKRYDFNNDGYKHYIVTTQELRKDELELLSQILTSFPHCSNSEWPNRFAMLNFEILPKNLLSIAANAYDGNGNTVLGVAAEYGKSVEAVQRLIDIGANLDTPDHNMNKLALHWAICNKLSWNNKTSYDAVKVVKCLLDNGAKTDITCYQNSTPLEYAKSRGYVAASSLIEENKKTVQLCFFKLKNMIEEGITTTDDIANVLPKDAVIPEKLAKLIKR